MNKRIITTLSCFVVICSAILINGCDHQPPSDIPVLQDKAAGGEGTVNTKNKMAFAQPLKTLPTEQLRDFFFGNRLFNTNWVTAPASVKSLDGLGPLFNRVSCSGCHLRDGRGRPPENTGDPMLSMLVRLSIAGTDAHGGPNPHSAYGGQLNDRAILNVPAEGRAIIHYDEFTEQFADGETYSLRKPRYEFINLNYGELGDDVLFSPRVSPAVYGLGLLEAIPKQTLESFADADDHNKDGISGRPNYVWDSVNQKENIGRFGWKANVANLTQQNLGAAVGDMGITSWLNPNENCTTVQVECQQAITGGTSDAPELNKQQADKLVFYTQVLAVPARRNINDSSVINGAKVFEQARCNACHIPQLKTGPHVIPELANQNIQPFTDLLLHDMGEALADKRPDYLANGQEWRTPPLWGIGLVEVVNKHSLFLHDGRARNLMEAVLWHGGEAEESKQYVLQLNKNDRDALITFLKSL